MKLYTAKGDDGTTTLFNCDQRISKSSAITEALGALDEVNSYLGLCKTLAKKQVLVLNQRLVERVVHELQDDLFTVQAELAGAKKHITKTKVVWLNNLIKDIEITLPPINSFLISGGSELSARFDFARTLARRAERRVVEVHEEGLQKVGKSTLAYLNRLSSALYALARYTNNISGVEEQAPDYE